MNLVPCREHLRILQHDKRLRLRIFVRMHGRQNIHMRIRQQKPRDAHHFIRAKSDRAHALRNLCDQPTPRTSDRQELLGDWLSLVQRIQQRAANQILRHRECSGDWRRRWPVDHLHILRLDRRSGVQWVHWREIAKTGGPLRIGVHGELAAQQIGAAPGDQQPNPQRYDQPLHIHREPPAAVPELELCLYRFIDVESSADGRSLQRQQPPGVRASVTRSNLFQPASVITRRTHPIPRLRHQNIN